MLTMANERTTSSNSHYFKDANQANIVHRDTVEYRKRPIGGILLHFAAGQKSSVDPAVMNDRRSLMIRRLLRVDEAFSCCELGAMEKVRGNDRI